MDAASRKALLFTGIFGTIAIFVMGWPDGGMVALLIFFACLCTAEA